jgi:outer membrane protein assembly factor BamB
MAPREIPVSPAIELGTYPELPGWDSPTYLHTDSRTAAAGGETVITASNAANLSLQWSFPTAGPIFSSPAVINGVAYFGSWDGYEYAVQIESGLLVWKTFLGTVANECGSGSLGITSSATIDNGTLYVGGGDARWYALSAATGEVLWNVTDGSASTGFYAWSSPLVLGSNMYVGLSSQCDHPLVPAALIDIDTATHSIVHWFNTTFNRTRGASIWASPSYDPWDGSILAATGNAGPATGSVPFGNSLLKFNATTLALLGHWQVPANQTIFDGDIGATPTVFLPEAGHPMVAVEDKNGIEYAFNATNISAGPVWTVTVAYASAADSIAPAAWGGGRLYVGGSETNLSGKTVNGAVRAINPLTGSVAWTRSEWQNVETAPTYSNGFLAVASGHHLDIVNASNGRTIVSLTAPANLITAPVISHGEIFAGGTNGVEYSYGLPLDVRATATNGTSASDFDFDAAASGGFPPYSFTWKFGDGTQVTSKKPLNHTYSVPGTYNVTVTVTDRTGGVANATVTVTVATPTRRPPSPGRSLGGAAGVSSLQSPDREETLSNEPYH